MSDSEILLDAEATAACVDELAKSIASRLGSDFALVAIRRGGVALVQELAKRTSVERVGEVDIALYRDDAATALPDPKIGPSHVPFAVDGVDIVIVDDVLQTGRTIRAAIDCLLDFGRPRRIWLAVLLDRGGRELPIAPDFCAKSVTVGSSEKISVVDDGGTLYVRKRVRR